ncbi:MAG: hypothetical protein Q8Q03_00300 [bacterium]|nr:hypothetical protein [bacterium]
MNIAIISFFASFAGIIGMIFWRRMPTVERWDGAIYAAYNRVRKFILYFNKRTAIALVQLIAYHILSWARSAYIWLHRKAHAHPPSKKVIDMVRGRGEVDRNGGTSFYLKKIGKEGIAK